MNPIEVGRVVIPKAGRDKGRAMIVVALRDEYAWIADGKLRKAESPKKKKCKHLSPQKELLDNIVETINNGRAILDADLRRALQETARCKEG